MGGDHLTKVLIDSMRPITRELNERLDADLSSKDMVAVGTALEKALAAGAQAGLAEAAAQVQEALPEAQVQLRQDVRSTDEWAERYG